MLVFTRGQLETVLAEYVDHYNCPRPHRSFDQASPLAMTSVLLPDSTPEPAKLDRLGGLIHEYKLAV